ncbi:MAG: IclR family transcriptional regulator [Actinomycetota bacterium]
MGLLGVDRTLDVLEALSEMGTTPLGEVSRATGLSKSVTHRLLQSLCERGYAVQDRSTGRYRLGLRVMNLFSAGLEGVDLRVVAHPALERLAQATSETVHLVVLEDDGVVYVDKVESTHPVRMASRIGMRGEPHCTAGGKAILADLPEEEVRALLARHGLPRRTPSTIVHPAALMRDLAEIRARGYAVDDIENEADVRCVGTAVLDAGGRPAGAVSVSAPAYRLPRERIAQVVPHLRKAVAEIAAGYGGEAGGSGKMGGKAARLEDPDMGCGRTL